MDQKTWRANKLGGPNTKLGGPVPGRPTRNAATDFNALVYFILFYFCGGNLNLHPLGFLYTCLFCLIINNFLIIIIITIVKGSAF